MSLQSQLPSQWSISTMIQQVPRAAVLWLERLSQPLMVSACLGNPGNGIVEGHSHLLRESGARLFSIAEPALTKVETAGFALLLLATYPDARPAREKRPGLRHAYF